jgi:type II secretory pathway pseudopilin PulG
LFLASSPELIRTVQQVRKGKQAGLKSSADFQALARHLPAQGNQFTYISKSFGETFAGIQKQAMGQSGLGAQDLATMQRLFGAGAPSYSLSIGAHTANGWQTTSVGNQDSAGGALILPAVAVTAIAAGMLLPALAKAKSRAQSISSVSNLKQLGLAARMYANDHGNKFPPAATWCDAIQENVMSPKPYKAPNDTTPGRCSYAYNAKLSDMAEGKVSPETVMFFEAEAGWNTSGGIEVLLPRPRQPGTYVIGLADGSVQQIPAARVRTLRWDP